MGGSRPGIVAAGAGLGPLAPDGRGSRGAAVPLCPAEGGGAGSGPAGGDGPMEGVVPGQCAAQPRTDRPAPEGAPGVRGARDPGRPVQGAGAGRSGVRRHRPADVLRPGSPRARAGHPEREGTAGGGRVPSERYAFTKRQEKALPEAEPASTRSRPETGSSSSMSTGGSLAGTCGERDIDGGRTGCEAGPARRRRTSLSCPTRIRS